MKPEYTLQFGDIKQGKLYRLFSKPCDGEGCGGHAWQVPAVNVQAAVGFGAATAL